MPSTDMEATLIASPYPPARRQTATRCCWTACPTRSTARSPSPSGCAACPTPTFPGTPSSTYTRTRGWPVWRHSPPTRCAAASLSLFLIWSLSYLVSFLVPCGGFLPASFGCHVLAPVGLCSPPSCEPWPWPQEPWQGCRSRESLAASLQAVMRQGKSGGCALALGHHAAAARELGAGWLSCGRAKVGAALWHATSGTPSGGSKGTGSRLSCGRAKVGAALWHAASWTPSSGGEGPGGSLVAEPCGLSLPPLIAGEVDVP